MDATQIPESFATGQNTTQKQALPLNSIILGDCLEILKTFPDKSIDLVVTDPPYNTGMVEKPGSARLSHFFNDNYTDAEYELLAQNVCNELFRLLKPDSGAYIFINWKSIGIWLKALKNADFKAKNCIVWDKVVHGLNYMNYAYTHEFIIFATKGNFLPKNKNGGEFWKDVWRIKRNLGNSSQSEDHHETAKSLEVTGECIKHGIDEGGVVLDPFLGSGTTALACKMLKRNYIGIEIEPKYVEMAEKRIKNYNPLF